MNGEQRHYGTGLYLRVTATAMMVVACVLFAWLPGSAAEKKVATTQPAGATGKPADTQPTSAGADANGMVDLTAELKLPRALPGPTPKPPVTDEPLEPERKGPRPKFLVPAGCKNVAAGKTVTSSDESPIIGELKCITDGVKECAEGAYVELGPGKQWVQIDLGERYRIYAIVVWHFHLDGRAYKDVVVRISDDAGFAKDAATTVFNTDHDNTSDLGAGKDKAYVETFEGKIIDGKGAKGRYVRLHSRGNTSDDQNQYVEVEVYALPAK